MDDHEDLRVESVDLVDSIAQLYNRSLRRGQALSLYYHAFSENMALRTGLRGQALKERVRQEVGPEPRSTPIGRPDTSDSDFEENLETLNGAFGRLDDAQRSRGR